MQEFSLKYGCNPNQKPARIFMENGASLPFEVLNGRPGYINFLDALNSWQLVSELQDALHIPTAASFKHVSPTSASVATPLPDSLKRACFVNDVEGLDDSPIACAYARARGTDRMSSFGDWAALSDTCDETTARLLQREVSDGIIAPDYTPAALEILKSKRKGGYNIVKIDPTYRPVPVERKQVFGVTFEQQRNDLKIDASILANLVTRNRTLPEQAKRDLIVALVTLKYTQSNSVCYAAYGQAIGVGAGQQSRIHCTRLAGSKADLWHLRQHPKVLALPLLPTLGRPDRDNIVENYITGAFSPATFDEWRKYFSTRPDEFTEVEKKRYLASLTGVSLGSDAFFPFDDNIRRAKMSGVSYIAEPGGSVRDDLVISACDEFDMVMAFTGARLFHH